MNCKKSSLTALPFSLDFMDKEVKDVTDSKLKKKLFSTTKHYKTPKKLEHQILHKIGPTRQIIKVTAGGFETTTT